VALALLVSGCASVEFTRDTETSGRFSSSGTAVTIFGYDFPGGAMQIALDNASDARQPNTQVTKQRVFPYLGPVDWLLDILSVRYARVQGTWGFAPGSGAGSLSGAPQSAPTSSGPGAQGAPASPPSAGQPPQSI
jgi:hypothetical protein